MIPKKPAFDLQIPQDPESRQEAAGLSPEPSQLSKEGDPHLIVGSFYYKNTDFKAECDEGPATRPPAPTKAPQPPLATAAIHNIHLSRIYIKYRVRKGG